MPRVVSIGRFTFDPERLVLYDGSEVVPLAPLQARMLGELVRATGEVVSAADMRKALWGDAPVEERNLNQQIYLLRRTLRRDPALAIENVPRRGYRLAVADASRTPWHARVRGLAVAAAACFAAALAAGVVLQGRTTTPLNAPAARNLEIANYFASSEGPNHLAAAAEYYRSVAMMAPSNGAGYGGLAFVDARRALEASGTTRRAFFDTASAEASSALRRNPRDSNALTAMGIVSSVARHLPCSAKDFFNAAVAADPTAEAPRSWRARFLLSIGEFERAGRDFAAIGQYAPTSGYAVGSLGEWLVLNRKYAKASSILARAVDLGNHPGFTRYWLARSYYQRGLYDKALPLANVLLAMYPGEASAIALRLRIEAAKGDMPAALADFGRLERISRVEETDPVAMASADVALGRTDQALQTVRRYMSSGIRDLDEIGRIRTDPDLDALRQVPAPDAPIAL
jgi:DNA-binding winged helix-turn-helix (wHTH) protein